MGRQDESGEVVQLLCPFLKCFYKGRGVSIIISVLELGKQTWGDHELHSCSAFGEDAVSIISQDLRSEIYLFRHLEFGQQ